MERTPKTNETDANAQLEKVIRELENHEYDTPTERELDEILRKVLTFVVDHNGVTFKEALMLKNIIAIADALLPTSFDVMFEHFKRYSDRLEAEAANGEGKPSGGKK